MDGATLLTCGESDWVDTYITVAGIAVVTCAMITMLIVLPLLVRAAMRANRDD